MELELSINGVITSHEIAPNESLLSLLRRTGCDSVKAGCETGECGACTVLVDGVARPSCVMLAAQAGGCALATVESLGSARNLHPLQQAFVEVGAVQCGFCAPGMLLAAHALLKRNPAPTEQEVRDALSGNLCRCAGYEKPVQAVLRASALLRNQKVEPLEQHVVKPEERNKTGDRKNTRPLRPLMNGNTGSLPTLARALLSDRPAQIVGKPVPNIEAVKQVTGKALYAADFHPRGLLYGAILTSPHAHAVIRNIDVSQAKALPGVHAVLTFRDMARTPYASLEYSPLEPGVQDRYCLDYLLRYSGDRVALVAAETPELAEEALGLIEVDYDVLPAVLDPRQALEPNAPRVHPESESVGIFDAKRNIVAHLRQERGEVEQAFAESELIVEGEYLVPVTQQAPLEKHTVITYFDENDDLVVRTSTQVPQHVQRTLAHVLSVPASRIRVVQPQVGGGSGAKQAVVLEDACALLTIATNRPVQLTHSRQAEFASGGARSQYIVRLKTGVKRDGTLLVNQLVLLANTGAYGAHPLLNPDGIAGSALSLYPCPNLRFVAEVLYTNLSPVAAYQGYNAMQEFFAIESHMDEVARQLGIDPLALRQKNWIGVGDSYPLSQAETAVVESCALADCARVVEEKLNWKERRGRAGNGRMRKGVGLALAFHGQPLVRPRTGGAMIKLREDGSFDVFTSVNDGGSGSATLLKQLVAEILDVSLDQVVLHSNDALTFGDVSSPASVLYVSGEAVMKAAEQVHRQILAVAGRMLNTLPESLKMQAGLISASNEQHVTIQQVATQALYVEQRYLMATTTAKVQAMPTTFAAYGAEVEVDCETGAVRVLKLIGAVDAGRVLNPLVMEGQIQGAVLEGLSAALCEELLYDQKGVLATRSFHDYHVYNTLDMPAVQSYLIEAPDPIGPFGAKSVAEVAAYGVAPAIVNAVSDALGARLRQLPLTPERVLRVVHAQSQTQAQAVKR